HVSMVEPLTLDEVADATKVVSRVLDDADVMGRASYTLEVSSPGVDQPLTTPARFRRNVGRLVSLVVGDAPVTSRLAAVGPDGIGLGNGPERVLSFAEGARARDQVEFTRPGGGKER